MTARTPPPSWHPESLLPPTRDAADRPVLWAALAVAGLLHLGALCLPLPPAPQVEVPEPPPGPIIPLQKADIPPPPVPEPVTARPLDLARRIPIPAPETVAVEPVVEPMSSPVPGLESDALPVWVGAEPVPPPAEPLVVDEWTPGVERPVALPGRAEPVYPETARRAKVEGVVVLRARINESGDVESITVLRESRPGLGFAAAAAEAVSTWKYRPGRLDGRPVSVMLTVAVEFKLR